MRCDLIVFYKKMEILVFTYLWELGLKEYNKEDMFFSKTRSNLFHVLGSA